MPSAARLRAMAAQRGVLPQNGTVERTNDAPVALTLPWSALHTGNRFFGLTSKSYRDAKAKAEALVLEQCPYERRLFTRAVIVDVTLYVPNRQRRDLLNYCKLICDAMTGLVYSDDSQICGAVIRRRVDVDRPRAEITVTALTSAPE